MPLRRSKWKKLILVYHCNRHVALAWVASLLYLLRLFIYCQYYFAGIPENPLIDFSDRYVVIMCTSVPTYVLDSPPQEYMH